MMNSNSGLHEEMFTPSLTDLKAFGLWIYLMSDLVLFSILFAVFAVVGHNYAGGPTPKDIFNLPYTFVETLCLLLSSTTMGISAVALFKDQRKVAVAGLIITFILGLGFISMELREFYLLINNGNGPSRSSFLSSFFTLVGMHGTHVSFGLIWILVMIIQVRVKGLTSGIKSQIYRLGMFWHFLDIVWIGVFTVVYLMGTIV